MSRIALTRLLVANDRSARRRLAGIVAGVMVGVTLFLMLLADHALFHIEADLRWMETTAARLSELREEVRS